MKKIFTLLLISITIILTGCEPKIEPTKQPTDERDAWVGSYLLDIDASILMDADTGYKERISLSEKNTSVKIDKLSEDKMIVLYSTYYGTIKGKVSSGKIILEDVPTKTTSSGTMTTLILTLKHNAITKSGNKLEWTTDVHAEAVSSTNKYALFKGDDTFKNTAIKL